MSELLNLRPGEEIEVGISQGWRYFVRRSVGRRVFWVLRRSLGFEEFSPETETLGVWPTRQAAEKVARRQVRGCRRGSWTFWGQ